MHVVVTGASAGIGEALVREYARAGAAVTLIARRKQRLDEIAAEVGGKTLVIAADLGQVEQAGAVLTRAEAELGPIDVLINNAGVQIVRAAEDTDPSAGEDLLRVDLHTPMRLTLRVLPGMLARRSGTIVDIASLAGLTPMPGMYYYNAAKGGLAMASESLRGELRGTGVHVVTVYPGPVDTAMARAAYDKYKVTLAARLAPQGTTEVLARLVRRAVERRKPRVIYPRRYAVARWFPNFSRWITVLLSPPLRSPALPPAKPAGEG